MATGNLGSYDSSFIAAANDWTTDDVKKIMNDWAEANADVLIP